MIDKVIELIHYLWHALLEILGIRKTGGRDEKEETGKYDPRDYKFSELSGAPTNKLPSGTQNFNINDQDQKNTMRCVGFSGGHVVSVIQTRKLKKKMTYEGNELWRLMLEEDLADEERGAFINSAPKVIVKRGFTSIGGVRFECNAYAMINPSEFRESLAKGNPIFTGIRVTRPMTDISWVLRMGGRKFGHAFVLVDFDDKEEFYYAVNSWRNWGIRGTGLFKIRYEDVERLFRSYVLLEES